MRTTVDSIAKVGRSTQGVHVMNVGASDRVASLACIDIDKPARNGNGSSSNGSRSNRRAGGRSSGRRTRRR